MKIGVDHNNQAPRRTRYSLLFSMKRFFLLVNEEKAFSNVDVKDDDGYVFAAELVQNLKKIRSIPTHFTLSYIVARRFVFVCTPETHIPKNINVLYMHTTDPGDTLKYEKPAEAQMFNTIRVEAVGFKWHGRKEIEPAIMHTPAETAISWISCLQAA